MISCKNDIYRNFSSGEDLVKLESVCGSGNSVCGQSAVPDDDFDKSDLIIAHNCHDSLNDRKTRLNNNVLVVVGRLSLHPSRELRCYTLFSCVARRVFS